MFPSVKIQQNRLRATHAPEKLSNTRVENHPHPCRHTASPSYLLRPRSVCSTVVHRLFDGLNRRCSASTLYMHRSSRKTNAILTLRRLRSSVSYLFQKKRGGLRASLASFLISHLSFLLPSHLSLPVSSSGSPHCPHLQFAADAASGALPSC